MDEIPKGMTPSRLSGMWNHVRGAWAVVASGPHIRFDYRYLSHHHPRYSFESVESHAVPDHLLISREDVSSPLVEEVGLFGLILFRFVCEDRKLGSPPFGDGVLIISLLACPFTHACLMKTNVCIQEGIFFFLLFSSGGSSEVFLHLSPSGTFG